MFKLTAPLTVSADEAHMNLAPIFNLARYSVFRLFGIFWLVWLIISYAMHVVERLVWGAPFLHWGDLILVGVLAIAFGYVAYRMGLETTIKILKEMKSG